MADNRKRSAAGRIAQHIQRLARWAELMALVQELEDGIAAAAKEKLIESHWYPDLRRSLEALRDDLIMCVPTKGGRS